jgi:hypothetical protein
MSEVVGDTAAISPLQRVLEAYFTRKNISVFKRHCIPYSDFLDLTGSPARPDNPEFWVICGWDTTGGHLIEADVLTRLLVRERLKAALVFLSMAAGIPLMLLWIKYGVPIGLAFVLLLLWLVGSVLALILWSGNATDANIKQGERIQYPEPLGVLLAEMQKRIEKMEQRALFAETVAKAAAQVAGSAGGKLLEAVAEHGVGEILEKARERYLERRTNATIQDTVEQKVDKPGPHHATIIG